ncbi:MAG: hypothetical protein CM15mP130_0420 [Verrucomicrobiota bacterium]|nr:MAG: hypothetical protein CM15mP130_0420 [Verrucomicrobiota bacterium]
MGGQLYQIYRVHTERCGGKPQFKGAKDLASLLNKKAEIKSPQKLWQKRWLVGHLSKIGNWQN